MRNFVWGVFLRLLKRWSRSGIYEPVLPILMTHPETIISVGGFGDVDNYLQSKLKGSRSQLISFDIDPKHSPDILGNVQELDVLLQSIEIAPELVIALEVLEHVQDPKMAVDSCFYALKSGGTFIFSTPWMIPIHDRPHDYHRFTPAALSELTGSFSQVQIYARGNYFDSLICLMLRALWAKDTKTKFLMMAAAIPSLLMRKPKLYSEIEKIDSTIGYITICVK